MSTRDDRSIRLVQLSDSYWKLTFDLLALNRFGPTNIPQLEEVESPHESDEQVKVVVFDSTIDGSFPS